MRMRTKVLLTIGLLCSSGPSWSAASCRLLAVPELDFGTYSALTGPADAEGNLLLSCEPDVLAAPTVSYTITLSPGIGSPSGFLSRKLTAGAFALDYNLYTDLTRTKIWGDGTGGSAVVGGACAGACAIPVYGRIAPGQSVPAARYRDDVIVSVDF